MTRVYAAAYQDRAKVDAVAKARGFADLDGEKLFDFVDPNTEECRVSRAFPSLDLAAAWLAAAINAEKTFFGEATVTLRESVDRRCRCCTCGGVRDLAQWSVDDSGLPFELEFEPSCPAD